MSEKIKIQIKNPFTDSVLFEHEKEDNTVMDTVVEAVRQKVYLGVADLRGADLSGACLCGAELRHARAHGANLSGAYLCDADLSGADLSGADLSGAYLRDAYLCGADLNGADLHGAYLRGADLRGTDLRGAKEPPYIPFACPPDGAFIGWKKVNNKLIKLLIPEDARRCSATTNKCRCDKALVLSITDFDGENPVDEVVNEGYYPYITYKVDNMVFPDSFDENRWNECSNGIHFFINKQDAINYTAQNPPKNAVIEQNLYDDYLTLIRAIKEMEKS